MKFIDLVRVFVLVLNCRSVAGAARHREARRRIAKVPVQCGTRTRV